MTKKIFDIIPPQQRKTYQDIAEDQSSAESENLAALPESGKNYGRTMARKIILFFSLAGFAIFFGAGLFLSYKFSNVEIEIWPRKDAVRFEETIAIASNSSFGEESKTIGAKIVDGKKTASQEFRSSGLSLRQEKARGILRVYNAGSTSSQTLLASTRFVSSQGKLFRSTKKAVIPGGTADKGKIVPGFLDIEVQAAEPGEDYNIGPATFSIPGFAGTPKYTTFCGKSFSPMTGGFKNNAAQMTQEDLEKAKNILAEKLKTEIKDSIAKDISPEFLLLEDTLQSEISEETASAKPGDFADSFMVQLTVKVKGLASKEAEIRSLALYLIGQNMEKGKKIKEESLKVDYSAKMSDKEGEAILVLKGQADVYSEFDADSLKKAVLGRSFSEAKYLLGALPDVSEIKLRAWPFWIRRIPEALDSLMIKLNID